jgi:hypothetical protein
MSKAGTTLMNEVVTPFRCSCEFVCVITWLYWVLSYGIVYTEQRVPNMGAQVTKTMKGKKKKWGEVLFAAFLAIYRYVCVCV